jgi:hypothetical protein
MKHAMKKILALLVLASLLLPLAAVAQEAPPPAPPAAAAAAAEPVARKTTLWDLIKTGGWAMWPLGLCSVGLVTMVVLNIRLVSRKNLLPLDVVVPIRAAAEQRDVGQMYALARSSPNLFTKGLLSGLRKLIPTIPPPPSPTWKAPSPRPSPAKKPRSASGSISSPSSPASPPCSVCSAPSPA